MRREKTRTLFNQITTQLGHNNKTGASYEPFKLSSDDTAYFGRDIQEQLDENLSANDFTTIKLPSCSDVPCDNYVEMGDSPDDMGT